MNPLIYPIISIPSVHSKIDEPKDIAFVPYEEIWEKEVQWLTGPGLLADIIEWLKDKSFLADINESNFPRMNIILPMPDIVNLIPDELKYIFCDRANIILDAYAYILYAIADPYIGMPINSETQARLCEDLYRMEIHARAERRKELWQVAATAFGFHPYRLPQRGHLVYAPQP